MERRANPKVFGSLRAIRYATRCAAVEGIGATQSAAPHPRILLLMNMYARSLATKCKNAVFIDVA